MNKHAETAVMLREAREYIEQHGWTQKTMRDATGRVCLLASLDANVTRHGHHARVEAERIVVNLIGSGIVDWNDKSGREKSEVITVLLAAEQCEKELAS